VPKALKEQKAPTPYVNFGEFFPPPTVKVLKSGSILKDWITESQNGKLMKMNANSEEGEKIDARNLLEGHEILYMNYPYC